MRGMQKGSSPGPAPAPGPAPGPASVLRLGVLALLWLQISMSILVVDYSRNIREEKFSNSDVVMLSEVVKLVISAVVLLLTGADGHLLVGDGSGRVEVRPSYSVVSVRDHDDYHSNDEEADVVESKSTSISTYTSTSTVGEPPVTYDIVRTFKIYYQLIRSSKKMVVIVILYAVSNIVALSAAEYLGSGVYNTVTQLKILTTALFGKFLLHHEYSAAKWRALILLVLGCVLVASPPSADEIDCDNVGDISVQEHSVIKKNKQILGFACVAVQVTISGFNSVYLEKILKMDRCSMWGRNFQMAFMSLVVLVCSTALFRGGQNLPNNSFMVNWTFCATCIVLIQSAGGLLVAATLKYADAVIKCFASAMSILTTIAIAHIFLGGSFSLIIFIGCLVTIVSLFNYIMDTSPET